MCEKGARSRFRGVMELPAGGKRGSGYITGRRRIEEVLKPMRECFSQDFQLAHGSPQKGLSKWVLSPAGNPFCAYAHTCVNTRLRDFSPLH